MNIRTTCAAGELDLADLKAADVVRIETLNSIYEFTVGDSATHGGTVSGGSFGDRVVEAVLVGENLRLKIGAGGASWSPRGCATGSRRPRSSRPCITSRITEPGRYYLNGQ